MKRFFFTGALITSSLITFAQSGWVDQNNSIWSESNGNVGIGNSNPGSNRLDVSGTVRAVNFQLQNTATLRKFSSNNDITQLRYKNLDELTEFNLKMYKTGYSYLNSWGTGATRITHENSTTAAFTADGNVGIGEINPTALLHLKDGSATLKIETTDQFGTSRLDLSNQAGSYSITASHVNQGASGLRIFENINNMGMLITSGSLTVGDVASSGTPSTGGDINLLGNVAIGHSNPSVKLHVQGTSLFEGDASVNGDLQVNGRMIVNDLDATDYHIANYIKVDDNPLVKALSVTNTDGTTTKETFTVFSDGKVRIGTQTELGNSTGNWPAGYRLMVDGGVICEEVKVEMSEDWGDFVFENDYELKSIEEVDSYVKENKHLPSIPSAKELSENGMEIAEMLRLQMIKIEELTLYTIQQEEKIKELKELVIK